jgi:hypothetical protein
MNESESPVAASDSESSQHEKITVVVNGRPREVTHRELTFEEVVRLAFDPVPSGPNVELTVSYRNAEGDKKGTLMEGQSVEVKNHGTVFNVTATDKS